MTQEIELRYYQLYWTFGSHTLRVTLHHSSTLHELLHIPFCDALHVGNVDSSGDWFIYDIDRQAMVSVLLRPFGEFDWSLPQSWFETNREELSDRGGAVWFYPASPENPFSEHEGPVFVDQVVEYLLVRVRESLDKHEFKLFVTSRKTQRWADDAITLITVATGIDDTPIRHETGDELDVWAALLDIPAVTCAECYAEYIVEVDVAGLSDADAMREVNAVRKQVAALKKELGL